MPAYIWYPTFAGLTVGFSFMNIPPLANQFMALFGVGYAGLSLFLSGLIWAHAFMQIPAGLIVDRIGVYRGVILSCGIGVAANLLPFIAPESLAFATAMRFLLGICTGILFLTILKIIGVLAPADQMPKAQGLYGGAFGFGTMLPYFILPYLGERAWVHAYLVSAVMYAMCIAFLLLLPYAKLSRRAVTEAVPARLGHILATIFASREVWILGVIHGLCYGTLSNLGQWMPSILADLADSPLTAWTLATTLVLCLGSCSRSLSGYVLKLFSRAATINGVMLALFLLYVVMGMSGNAHLSLVLGLALAIAAGFNYGAVFTLGSRVLPPVFMGTALGLLNTVANIANVGMTLLFGNVREHTGSFGPALISVGVLSLAVLLITRRQVARMDRAVD